MADITAFTIIGAAHLDYNIQLMGPTRMHRTNVATSVVSHGGVAANIARHMAATIAQNHAPQCQRPHFVGVCGHAQHDGLVADFNRWQIRPQLVAMAGETPSYTALIDAAGDLVIGAANMALYDAATANHILPHLPRVGVVVIDANFPSDVLAEIAAHLPMAVSLFAAGTAVEKVSRLTPLLSRLDGIVMNRAEAAALVGDGALDAMAADIMRQLRSRAFVMISDADKEAILACGDHQATCRPPQITPVNVNGAGDAMAAELFLTIGSDLIGSSQTVAQLRELASAALASGASFAAGEHDV